MLPSSPLKVFPQQLLSSHPCIYMHVFSHCFLLLYCLLILSDISSIHFVTFLLQLVKRLQLKAFMLPTAWPQSGSNFCRGEYINYVPGWECC